MATLAPKPKPKPSTHPTSRPPASSHVVTGTNAAGHPIIAPSPPSNTLGNGNPDQAPGAWTPHPAAAPATPAAPAAAPAPGDTAEGKSARSLIASTLTTYGLPESLADWVWSDYLQTGNIDQTLMNLRAGKDPGGVYNARFPGMAELRKAGKGIDEGTYIATENGYRATMHKYGLPETYYDDPTDFAKLITGDTSPSEFDDRVSLAAQVVATDPAGQHMRDQLGRLYGMSNATGLTIAYWIDPEKGADLIKKQFVSAQMAVQSDTTGFGSLTVDQAEKVGATGATADSARQTFSQLASLDQLRHAGIGDAGDQGLSQDTLINAGFTGSAEDQKKVAASQRRRVAAFEGGGSFASDQGGVSGLSRASS